MLKWVLGFLGRPNDDDLVVRPSPPARNLQEQKAPVRSRAPSTSKVGDDLGSEKGSTASTAVQTVPSRQVANKRRRATAEDLAQIEKMDVAVMSALGGRIELTEAQRIHVAALDNGLLLIAESSLQDNMVDGAIAILNRNGFKAKLTLLVDLQVIRKVNQAFEKRGGLKEDESDVAMQRRIFKIIQQAAAQHCSDIRFRVNRHEAVMSVRRDGVYKKVADMPSATGHDLLRAAFFASDVSDTNYRSNAFQSARLASGKFKLPEKVQSIRMEFAPMAGDGRLLQMRILYFDTDSETADVDDLGYADFHIEQIKRMRRMPQGVNVICGPTGSGKSTTLKRSLSALIREQGGEINVVTVEDPPEYEITDASQLPVTNAESAEERQEEMRKAMASTLRLDPDTIMIGEIRDKQSGGLVFQAAMSGHGVWTTVHAVDAMSILDRLRDLGVEAYKLTDHTLVTGLVGQRLVRCVCPKCSVPIRDSKDRSVDRHYDMLEKIVGPELAQLARVGVPARKGEIRCDACDGDGYSGRTVVAETILPDAAFMELVRVEQKNKARDYWLENLQGITMLEHGLFKILSGQIDPRDIESKVGIIDVLDSQRIEGIIRRMGSTPQDLLEAPYKAKAIAAPRREKEEAA